MNLTTRQELGSIVGFAVTLLLGAGLMFVLHPLSRGRRVLRAGLWCWAWGLGAWVGYAADFFIGGTHRVSRVRATGGWTDWHVEGHDAAYLGLGIGVIAALLALWLPFTPDVSPPSRRPRNRRRRA